MQTAENHPVAARLSWLQRMVLILGGGILLALLVTAASLRPDPRGFGTHQGLGLPPCTVQQLFGIRCPSCGMTTSWALMLRGHVVGSFQANVGGALLCLASLAAVPWAIGSGLRGRWWGPPVPEIVVLVVLSVVLAATMVDWMVRLLLDW